jgi:type II restriction/modification system DNA methylase subunit YeeA
VPAPAGQDANTASYTFEKGVTKTGGGSGWADVWKRGCFGWEYKSRGENLGEALKQLKMYAGALENPPLLIVSDMERIEIHTNWTNMVQETVVFSLDDLGDARNRDKLRKAFLDTEIEAWKPGQKRADLTRDVANKFVAIAQRLRDRGEKPDVVAHFVNRLLFCMFAEDVGLLPSKLFKKMLQSSLSDPKSFTANARTLFAAMAKQGGRVGFDPIEWFNGGLFDDDTALVLDREDIKTAIDAADQDWSNIDPSIMGTLFERGLDPDKRSQLGAHYTDPEKIMMIVNPVIIEPLTREWAGVKTQITAELDKRDKAKSAGAKTQAFNRATSLKVEFLERLKRFRILDPACGSGNFLYLGLKALKDIEHRVNTECEALGIARDFPAVGPENMLGIEINPFAAELARVSVWIGEIQWMREHGFNASRNPILKSLDNIRCHDALLNPDGTEYAWPAADVIIGNPPFLGTQLMIGRLGQLYVNQLRSAYEEATGGAVDLVTYWIAKAWAQIELGAAARVGFVATQAVRRGNSQEVLQRIYSEGRMFDAWSDEPWIVDGASVRVSLVCFEKDGDGPQRLDGSDVAEIYPDLTSGIAMTDVARLATNVGACFQGPVKVGAFDVDGDVARNWLLAPVNPNGRANSDVLRPWLNGNDVTKRPSGKWIVDFAELSESDAASYEAPFEYVKKVVKPARDFNRRDRRRVYWWQHGETVPGLRAAVSELSRMIVTTRVAKYRIFRWATVRVLPDTRLVAVAREDDVTFGILQSRHHLVWSSRFSPIHGDGDDGGRPTYAHHSTFETFSFPEGLTPNIPASDYAADPRAEKIAAAAKKLNDLRENWLNPANLVKRVPEVVPGYPDRVLPVDEAAAKELKKRTLTNLYNERPTWLDHAHRDLDAAVAAAYGWTDWGKDGLPDDVILERLFKLNQERAKAEQA